MILLHSNFDHDQTGFNTWEGGEWNGVEGGYPTSITRSTDFARYGTHSAKFVINDDDPFSAGSIRAELTDWPHMAQSSPIGERWYGMSIYLPPSYVTDPCEELLFQWHGDGATSSGGESMNNPAIAMHTVDGHWQWFQVFGGKFNLGNYETGVWTDIVVHIRFSPTGAAGENGLIEVWKNGILVHTYTGKNTYNDTVGNYHKIGIYKYGWPEGYPTVTTTRTLYFDSVRIGNQTSSYAEVDPSQDAVVPDPPVGSIMIKGRYRVGP